jgi:hypothetical protein
MVVALARLAAVSAFDAAAVLAAIAEARSRKKIVAHNLGLTASRPRVIVIDRDHLSFTEQAKLCEPDLEKFIKLM